MADIRIKDLATTAASTASDDFVAVDGSANGTRKLNAFSPTFGGNVVATGTLTVNSTTDSSSKDTGAIVTEGGLGVEKSATIGGNLTVSGTGTSSFGGEPSTGLATYTGNLRIQSSGNGPAAVNGIELQNSQSGSGYGYKIYTNNSNDYIGIAGRFGSATWTEFLAIKQNTGNLLIGTTTDGGQKLQVSGTAYVSGDATFAGTIALTGSSAGQIAIWNSTNANGIYHTYQTNGTSIGDIGSAAQAVSGSASDFGITSRAGKLVLGTSSAARVTIDTSGNLIAAVTGTAPTLGTNSTMTFELTSNTSLTIKVRGTDGTTRSVALTLA